MSQVLKKIKAFDQRAARALENAGLCTDAELRSLTREDLRDLFPGPQDFKLRRSIFEKINSCRPVDAVLKDLKAFIPNTALREGLSANGPLVDYLCLLKEMKNCVSSVQDFVEAHINLLEESREDSPQQESDKGGMRSKALENASSSQTQGPQQLQSSQQPVYSRPSQPRASFPTVKYKKVVSGKTLRADEQLMDKVKRGLQDKVQLVETSDDNEITLLFCPIISRIQTDTDAAMTILNDNKPVILVLMHHTYTPLFTSVRSRIDDSKFVLVVNVFFHDTKSGLLVCPGNDAAVDSIQGKLLELKGLCVSARNDSTTSSFFSRLGF